MGLADRVGFPRPVAVTPEVLAALDVVVQPFLRPRRLLALLEAMAAGRAIVASDIPAHREFVTHGQTGYLVPPGNERAIAFTVSHLLADRTRIRALGARAHADARRRFSLDRVVEQNLSVYERLGARSTEPDGEIWHAPKSAVAGR